MAKSISTQTEKVDDIWQQRSVDRGGGVTDVNRVKRNKPYSHELLKIKKKKKYLLSGIITRFLICLAVFQQSPCLPLIYSQGGDRVVFCSRRLSRQYAAGSISIELDRFTYRPWRTAYWQRRFQILVILSILLIARYGYFAV